MSDDPESNRIRALSEVVSLDAWHTGFDNEKKKGQLFADVTFQRARLGGQLSPSIRFKLHLKRAEVVALVRPSEGLAPDPFSVRRVGRASAGVRSFKSKASRSTGGSGSFGGSFSSEGAAARIGLEIEGCVGDSEEESVEIQEEIQVMQVTHSLTPDSYHKWTIVPNGREKILEGKPWSAVAEPLMDFVANDRALSAAIGPEIAVEVRCLREDLDIFGMEYYRDGVWRKISELGRRNAKIVAAEQYIKAVLTDRGLVAGALDDPYSYVQLARATSIEANADD